MVLGLRLGTKFQYFKDFRLSVDSPSGTPAYWISGEPNQEKLEDCIEYYKRYRCSPSEYKLLLMMYKEWKGVDTVTN